MLKGAPAPPSEKKQNSYTEHKSSYTVVRVTVRLHVAVLTSNEFGDGDTTI